jgi:hypothetical protein
MAQYPRRRCCREYVSLSAHLSWPGLMRVPHYDLRTRYELPLNLRQS